MPVGWTKAGGRDDVAAGICVATCDRVADIVVGVVGRHDTTPEGTLDL